MCFRPLTLLIAVACVAVLSACGTDEKSIESFDPALRHDTAMVNAASASNCGVCHAAAPHFDGMPVTITGGSWSGTSWSGTVVTDGVAQYMYQGQQCEKCHAEYAENSLREEFAASAHADITGAPWVHYDWRMTAASAAVVGSSNRSSCVRCHTATGFVARLGDENATTLVFAPDNGDAGKIPEILACNACHTDTAGAIRSVPRPFTINLSNSATVTYDVPGATGLCVRCHGGRETGDSIKASTGDFGNLSFINSHYLSAGGTVYNKTGYHYYADALYAGFGRHKYIGDIDLPGTSSRGPCVTCHMSAGQGHTWTFVEKDAIGSITANNSPLCVSCHTAMDGAILEEKKEVFATALEELGDALAAKGIYFYNAHPYFYKDPNGDGFDPATEAVSANAFKAWDGVDVGGTTGHGKDVMGAAFNYNLLEHDPGAFAHNRNYGLKLIADSLDFLNDGVMDGDSSLAATLLPPP